MLLLNQSILSLRRTAGAVGRSCLTCALIYVGLFVLSSASNATPDPNIEIPLADRSVRSRLEQADSLLAGGQTSEAVTVYIELMNAAPEGLLPVSPNRYLSVRRAITLRLASMSPEGIAVYRDRVGLAAEDAYRLAEADSGTKSVHEPDAWEELVEAYPLSLVADNAIDRLAQIALERGDFATARARWESLLPANVDRSDENELDSQPMNRPISTCWFAYPDSEIEPKEIRARLAALSTLEGDFDRAKIEAELFSSLHPGTNVIRSGATSRAVLSLENLLEESQDWADRADNARPSKIALHPNWTTFAGFPTRQRHIGTPLRFGQAAWEVPLLAIGRERGTILDFIGWDFSEDPAFVSDKATDLAEAQRLDPRPPDPALAYFPVVWNELIFVAGPNEILAYEQKTGAPAWGMDTPVAFRDPELEVSEIDFNIPPCMTPPCLTLTIHKDALYAKVGGLTTAFAGDSPLISDSASYGRLVCLDLAAEGRLSWTIPITTVGDAFEGAPLADDHSVYVAMRRTDVTSRSYVACFDARTGVERWRTFVSAAEPLGKGRVPESTHNLLTLRGDTIYYNTNLGSVVALNCRTGEIRWLTLYPRSADADPLHPKPHHYRTVTPCLYHKHRLYVAPSDASRIFALDAHDGRILWNTSEALDDVVHLLGATDDALIASGNRLYWIALQGSRPGQLLSHWPESADTMGYGRGLVSDDKIYWPSRHSVLQFDTAQGIPVREYPLTALGIESGNLIASGDRVFIAGSRTLTALESEEAPSPSTPETSPKKLTTKLTKNTTVTIGSHKTSLNH